MDIMDRMDALDLTFDGRMARHKKMSSAVLSLDFFFFVKDCSEKKAPSHWHISVSSSDCGAFTRHCLWGISHPRLKPGVKHG